MNYRSFPLSQWFKMGKRIIWNVMVIPSVKCKPMFLIFCLGSWVYNWSVGVTCLVKCLNPIFVCNSSRLVLYCLVAIQIWYRHGNNPILNSLVPGRFEWKICIGNLQDNFDVWCISCEIVCRQMSLDLTSDKSTLVQVMAWCRQATSHYVSQCWQICRHMVSLCYNELTQVTIMEDYDWVNNRGISGLSTGNKPLPEPILTEIYVTMWCH